MDAKTQFTKPAVSLALAKAREDDACDETFSDMLGAVYAAAKALKDVPNARVSVQCLTEEHVAAFADAFEVKVEQQVTQLGYGLNDGRPVVIYSFHGVYEGALTGGKYDVAIDGQGSRSATADEAREHGVRTHEDVKVLTGDAAVALVAKEAR